MTIKRKHLVFIWLILSIGVIVYATIINNKMTLYEVAAAIYFMALYSLSVIAYGIVEKDIRQLKKPKIKDLDLVSIPDHMMPGCPADYPDIKIYRTYQLPKLDSEDLFETYERTMFVHPAAAIEKGDMVKRKDLIHM